MKLTPQAKPIRIRIVSGGEEHSSIESLRNNYSLKDILPRVKDGQLYKWLDRIGESKSAERARNLKDKDIRTNSKDIIELTALIFSTTVKNIEELVLLWREKYPKSFQNYINEPFDDISLVHELYDSLNEDSLVMTMEEWRNIFITTLKGMPLEMVLEDFKKYKSAKPMNSMAWLKVLKYHSNLVSDEELYLIAQATYDHPYLKDEAVEWFQKSARTYIKAKEWVNKNVKRTLTPKEKELFDAFERNPEKFIELFFNSRYPQDLVRFLNVLSSTYRTNFHPYFEQIRGADTKYAKYLFMVDELYSLPNSNKRGKINCIKNLKQLQYNYPYAFQDYKTLDNIISSLENEEAIFGVRLWEKNYREIILFIAGLAKTELENEK